MIPVEASQERTELPVIYLNENIEYPVKKLLERSGFSVVHTLDAGNSGKPDDFQLEFSAQKNWVMVTHNRRDFRIIHQRWATAKKNHGGIIVIGSVGQPEVIAQRIAKFFHIQWRSLPPSFCEAPPDI